MSWLLSLISRHSDWLPASVSPCWANKVYRLGHLFMLPSCSFNGGLKLWGLGETNVAHEECILNFVSLLLHIQTRLMIDDGVLSSWLSWCSKLLCGKTKRVYAHTQMEAFKAFTVSFFASPVTVCVSHLRCGIELPSLKWYAGKVHNCIALKQFTTVFLFCCCCFLQIRLLAVVLWAAGREIHSCF